MEDLINSFKILTRYSIIVLIVLLATSIYVFQRNLLFIYNPEYLINKQLNEGSGIYAPQTSLFNFDFFYATMNIFWPVLIVLFYYTFYFFLKRQHRISLEILKERNDFFFDPFFFYSEMYREKLTIHIVKALCFIPLFAVLMHAIGAGYLLYWNQVFPSYKSNYLTTLYLQVSISSISFLILLTKPFKVFNLLRKFSKND